MARLYNHASTTGLEERLAGSNELSCFKPLKTSLLANTCNPAGSSWASHENLLARRELAVGDYVDALAAHNLSRIVWAGAGHVQPTGSNGGFRFCLSEKADHIWEVANDLTTRSRPLVNLRDIPYADHERFRRIHGTTGETVFSPVVNALRLASTSIVLRACEVGASFDDLMPFNPIRAIRTISNDPTLKAVVELVDGRTITGLELQRELAERSIRVASEVDNLTTQEEIWAIKWLRLLDDLEEDPQKCAKRVDWVVKSNLIERELSASRPDGVSDYSVAAAKAADYHRVLPGEGAGMRLIRKGFFENSPTADQLDYGLPLADNTRARLRAGAIKRLQEMGANFGVSWEVIKIHYGSDWGCRRSYLMKDPFSTTHTRLEGILDIASV